jgi:small-conductance mechanosensitive channel
MHDLSTIIALGCVAAGALLGVAAEYAVRRLAALRPFHSVAFGVFIVAGLYAAAIEMQGGHHVAPVTHRAFVALLIIFATIVCARAAGAWVGRYGQHPGQSLVSISLFVNVTEILVGALGALVVLDYLGISIAPILTAFGIGGLAVALALQDTLANFFAGIEIAASRQVNAGDFIALDADNRGTIVDINWRNTVIADGDGNHIIVPNQKLASAIFTNYARPLRTSVTIPVERKADLAKLAQIASQTAATVAQTAKADITTAFDKVSDSVLELTVTIPARDASDRRRIRSQFTEAFLQRMAGQNGASASTPSTQPDGE